MKREPQTTNKPLSKQAQAALAREENGYSERLEAERRNSEKNYLKQLEAARSESETDYLKQFEAARRNSLAVTKIPSKEDQDCPDGPGVAHRPITERPKQTEHERIVQKPILDGLKARKKSEKDFLKKLEAELAVAKIPSKEDQEYASGPGLAHLPVAERPKQTEHGRIMQNPIIDNLTP